MIYINLYWLQFTFQ